MLQGPDVSKILRGWSWRADAVAAMNCQSQSDDLRLMFKEHFAARWRVICFTADSKTASRFYDCNQSRPDER